MLTQSRVVLTMIGLVALTAATLICLTYSYFGPSIVFLEFAATFLFLILSMVLALGTTRMPLAPRSQANGGAFTSLADALTCTATIMRDRTGALLRPLDGRGSRGSATEAARVCIAIVKSASQPVISKALDGTITGWNPAAERLYQYTAAEAIGRNISIIVPPERIEEGSVVVAKALKEGRVDNFETVRVTKNGRKIDVSLSLFMVEPPVGNTVGADITRDLSEDNFNLKKAANRIRFVFKRHDRGRE